MRTVPFRDSTMVRSCTALTALLTLGLAPSPEPAAAGTPTPLTEIGRVRTSVCSTIVVHANSAIDDALSNDADLRTLIVALTNANMADATELKRHNMYHDLERAASKLRETALDGEGEVRRMRALAADSPEPRKSELKAFADAIGGALYRQRVMAIDAQRLAIVQQGRAETASDNTTFANSMPAATPRPMNPAVDRTIPAREDPVDSAFRDVAADFLEREKRVTVDEGVAADHSLGATTGC